MIRGGGAPNKGMAPEPLFRLDPPPRSFAADAHGCIMVRAPRGPPDTSSRRDDPRPMANSPRIVITHVPGIGAQALIVVRMVPKTGVADVRRAVSTTVRTAASPSAAHIAR